MRHIVQLAVSAQYVGSSNNMYTIFPGITGEHLPVAAGKLRQIVNSQGIALLITYGH
ncbi:hypothetical protein D3C86_2156760 [compost metagenome]